VLIAIDTEVHLAINVDWSPRSLPR